MNINKLKKNQCNFTKKYIEPTHKYNIFSFSIFYMDIYKRFFSNYSKDVSIQKQKQFLYNLTLNIQNLERGFFGDNWYIRIFYDKSLFKFKDGNNKPWDAFIKTYENNRYVQFVEFKCSEFENKNIKDSHINLFGTFARLYPIFEKNDLLETVVIFDADNMITKDYFDEILEFKKTNYHYNSFCSNYEFCYYKNHNAIDNNNCYLRCGMVSFNIKLPIEIWDYILYQLKTFDDVKFNDLLNKLYNSHCELMPEKKIKSYKEFEYGIDEIVLNYYIKKYMDIQKYKLRVVRYKPFIIPIINTIITYMKYNSSNKIGQKNIVISILKNILKDDYTGKLNDDLNKFNKLYFNNIKMDSLYQDISPYLDILKKNFELLNQLNLPNTIINFIKNINTKDFDNIKDFSSYFYSYKYIHYL
jgi:hypothetical protein